MLPITTLYALPVLLVLTVLAINMTRVRAQHMRSDDEVAKAAIHRASRAHGNTLEHSIPVLFLMLLLELQGGSAAALHLNGAAFLGARLLYAYGMLRRPGSAPMVVAATITYLVEIVLLVLLFLAMA